MATTSLKQKKVYDNFSRLRFYDIVWDDRIDKVRLGMKDRNFINTVKAQVQYQNWKIPNRYEYRPDLISNYFYSTPTLWWVLVEYNEFFRVPQDFYADRLIKVPDANQLTSLLI
jgi:hypothetical protein